MPKGKKRQRQANKSNIVRPPAPVSQRRIRAKAEPAAPRRSRSQAMRLVAEIERLERELAAAQAEMAALAARAEIDPLTEIFNRRGFERELRRACAYVKRYGTSAALIYLDLDGFKHINDSHGHAAGDAVLRAVAMVLSRHVRASDLAARIGGDEFAVLVLQCDEVNAQAKALALEAALARMTPTYGDARLAIRASAGVAMLLPLDQPEQVLERADRAMYNRKRAGRPGDAAAE